MAQISAALEAEHSTWEGAGEVGLPGQTAPSLFVAVDAIKAHHSTAGHRGSNRGHPTK